MSQAPRMIRQWTPTGIFGLVALLLLEQRLNPKEPDVDPNAVTIGEMNRTMVRMDATLTALNQKLDPLADRVSRLEFWREAVTATVIDHGTAIRALQGKEPEGD